MTVVHYGIGALTACSMGRNGWKSADKSKVSCNACKATLRWRTDWFAS